MDPVPHDVKEYLAQRAITDTGFSLDRPCTNLWPNEKWQLLNAAGTQGRLRKPELEPRRAASGAAASSRHDVPATRYLSKVVQLQRRILEMLAQLNDGPRPFDDASAFWWRIPYPSNDELHLLSEASDTYHRQVAIDDLKRGVAYRGTECL